MTHLETTTNPEEWAPMPVTPVSRPWRRFLRISIRGLIVLVLVVDLWLGWLVRMPDIHRDAVAAIVNAGGTVNYSWGRKTVSPIPMPRWLMKLIGDDYFGHAVDVTLLTTSTPTDATAAQIGRLTQLKCVWATPGLGLSRDSRVRATTPRPKTRYNDHRRVAPRPPSYRVPFPMSETPDPNPRRRFLRLSVGGLLVLLLVLGAWLGWLVRDARIQREAVTAIKRREAFCLMTVIGVTAT